MEDEKLDKALEELGSHQIEYQKFMVNFSTSLTIVALTMVLIGLEIYTSLPEFKEGGIYLALGGFLLEFISIVLIVHSYGKLRTVYKGYLDPYAEMLDSRLQEIEEK